MKKLLFISVFLFSGLLDGAAKMEASTVDVKKSSFALQLYFGSLHLTAVRDGLTPVIDMLIKRELGLLSDDKDQFFLPKKLHRLTLYCINDCTENNACMLFNALTSSIKNWHVNYVQIRQEVDFFGENKDELVMKVDDTKKELKKLHKKIKTKVHKIADKYAKNHVDSLYDRTTSEQFAYVPHIGLGRIRIGSIGNICSSKKLDVDSVLAHIRQQVKETVVGQLALVETILKPSFIRLLDLNSQKYVAEISLQGLV